MNYQINCVKMTLSSLPFQFHGSDSGLRCKQLWIICYLVRFLVFLQRNGQSKGSKKRKPLYKQFLDKFVRYLHGYPWCFSNPPEFVLAVMFRREQLIPGIFSVVWFDAWSCDICFHGQPNVRVFSDLWNWDCEQQYQYVQIARWEEHAI